MPLLFYQHAASVHDEVFNSAEHEAGSTTRVQMGDESDGMNALAGFGGDLNQLLMP